VRLVLPRPTLVPRLRLLWAVVGGAGLLALTAVGAVFWVIVVGYHAVLVVALVRDARRLPGPATFSARRHLPKPFSLGAEQAVSVAVVCPAAAGLRCELADHVPAALGASPRVVSGTFDLGGEVSVEYAARPPSRGAYLLPALDVRVWRPDGWWSRQFRLPLTDEVAVYPDVLAIRRWELTLRRGVRALPGQRRGRPPGAATTPAGLRDYLPGDDVRRVHWKATARRDRPITMELEAERGQQVVIALDCGRLMSAPAGPSWRGFRPAGRPTVEDSPPAAPLTKLDHAVNAALLLAWVAQSQGDRVGLLTFDDQVRSYLAPRRGLRQVHNCNEALYRVTSGHMETDFGQAFGWLAGQLRGRSLVVVLTDVLDAAASEDLVAHGLRLGARHRALVVAMTDPELVAALRSMPERSRDVYRWVAAEEVAAARRQAFETLQRGGVACLDVEAGRLSPALVERYLELKERGMI
jgi:uncharacterized protein (DUF58 family)